MRNVSRFRAPGNDVPAPVESGMSPNAMTGKPSRYCRTSIVLVILGALWTASPAGVAAQTGQQPGISLIPGAMDRTTVEFGCRIPVEIASMGTGGPKDIAVAVEARDRDGRKLESSGFRTDQLPAVGAGLHDMDLQFSQAACGDIATIVVTSATCTSANGTVTSCLDRVSVEDRDSAVAYEVDAD
jgi:hypothetical protein